LVPITGIIGTNPLAQFADWKLAGDDAELKREEYLELIRKDALPYESANIAKSVFQVHGVTR
jgi:hypothetical protein